MTDLIWEEEQHIENQVKLLHPTQVVMAGHEFFIFQEMLFTVMDRNVCNAVTSPSSA
jgi:hypothetical protein